MAPVQYIVDLLRRLHKCNSRSEASHLALGRKGERIAIKFLRQNGHRILYKNYKPPQGGEIDLITRDRSRQCLVFVEVKTRKSEQWGRPLDAVDRKKRQRILRGAASWLRLLDNPEVRFRFDVVEVIMLPAITVRIIEGAFELPNHSLY